jgi:hypothetical protein
MVGLRGCAIMGLVILLAMLLILLEVSTSGAMAATAVVQDGRRMMGQSMRLFNLLRTEDVSGVSGVGRVAQGVQFHDGQCVVSWFGVYHSIEVHPNIETVEQIHGHEGKTRVEWLD